MVLSIALSDVFKQNVHTKGLSMKLRKMRDLVAKCKSPPSSSISQIDKALYQQLADSMREVFTFTLMYQLSFTYSFSKLSQFTILRPTFILLKRLFVCMLYLFIVS